MKTHTRIVLGTVVGVAAVVGLTSAAVHASGWERGGWHGHGGRGEHAMRLFERVDADADGRVTAQEIAAFRAGQIAEYDADADGALSLDEFAGAWTAFMRPRMVDRFQRFDDDGDGRVTEAELGRPFERMAQWFDRDGDAAIGRDEMMRRHHRDRDDDRDED